jgi:hypothetical protein
VHRFVAVLIVATATDVSTAAVRTGLQSRPPVTGLHSQPQVTGVSSERPLPDLKPFAAEVRRRWREARRLQAQYTFIERREEVKLTALGKVKEGPVKVYEVYPSPEPGNTYKRLIAVDGKPLSKAEIEKNDRIHRQHVLERMNESPADKARRAREEAKERAEEERTIDEIFKVYDIRLVRRESFHGHPTVVATFEPRPEYRARTDEAKIMKKVRATAWIHEAEYQIVRVEVEAIDNIGVGLGVLGKVYKGTTGEYVRTKVNDEVWLPVRARLTARGRALVRKFDIDQVTEWSDYKKFVVTTEEAMR